MNNNIKLKKIKISNGEILGYRESENGEIPILFLHGNMSSSKHWDTIFERLPNNFKIYAPDMRGFGFSTYNTPVNSLNNFSEDLKLFVDEINLKEFYLTGWSTGAGVSMIFSANYPTQVK